MIDFDALVLAPCEDIFSLACMFTLNATAPGLPPILARGVYSSQPLDVQMENDTIFSDQATSLGIRIRDFSMPPDGICLPPGPGDQVQIAEPTHIDFGKTFWIGDSDADGQGGLMLLLRVKEPPA